MSGISGSNRWVYILGTVGLCTVLAMAVKVQVGTDREAKSPRPHLILVKGVETPKDDGDDFLVYSDQGVFRVSDKLLGSRASEDALFLFALGTRYQVETSASDRAWLGSSYPVITEATPLPGQREEGQLACGNHDLRRISRRSLP